MGVVRTGIPAAEPKNEITQIANKALPDPKRPAEDMDYEMKSKKPEVVGRRGPPLFGT
jgi:hypothetical protein